MTLRAANLALKFLLELASVAALAYWGTTIDSGVVGALIAIAASAATIALWGRFAAPRSEHRLHTASRVPFELAVFALAALALLDAGQTVLAVILATLAVTNIALLTRLEQWDR
ncbi:MAG: YrdB family protein [Solirubrobacterales bacterium]|nr:YrdB family protein [Solirubrobacterales bacterium]